MESDMIEAFAKTCADIGSQWSGYDQRHQSVVLEYYRFVQDYGDQLERLPFCELPTQTINILSLVGIQTMEDFIAKANEYAAEVNNLSQTRKQLSRIRDNNKINLLTMKKVTWRGDSVEFLWYEPDIPVSSVELEQLKPYTQPLVELYCRWVKDLLEEGYTLKMSDIDGDYISADIEVIHLKGARAEWAGIEIYQGKPYLLLGKGKELHQSQYVFEVIKNG